MIPLPLRRSLLVCLFLTAACGGAPPASPSTTDAEAVSASMDTVYECFTRAYRLGEVDSVAVLYADAPLYLPAPTARSAPPAEGNSPPSGDGTPEIGGGF